MTYDDLIKTFGGLTKASNALGLSKQCVGHWKRRGRIPFEKQYLIQLKTKGRLKAQMPSLPKQAA